jgi:hypothetical protein
MKWEVELDDDFALWLNDLAEHERREILAHAVLLRTTGPQLGRPYVDTVNGSVFMNMKELRIRIDGDPWRVLFAFDPRRCAILLVGGNKGGDKRWYKTHIPIADQRFKRHLERLGRSGQ